MRPKKIIMSAFGPYAKETVIDMDKLGTSGLYLITGDTGAGKTTIFDAISYALFGEASGDIRETSMFRSKYASKETPTFVELVFDYDGKEYRIKRNPEYMRPNKRGDGETKEIAKAELVFPDGRVISQLKEVTRTVEALLGVNKKQFSQICMIAQGDFRKLLDADTKSRIEIFRQIFKTENFKKVQDDVNADTKELYGKKEDIKKSVNQYIDSINCDETDVISLELENAKTGKMLTEDAIKVIEYIIDKDEKALDKANDQLEIFDKQLTDVNTQLETLKKQKDSKDKFEENKEKIAKNQVLLGQAKEILEKEKLRQNNKNGLNQRLIEINTLLPRFDELEKYKKDFTDCANESKELQEKINVNEEDFKKLSVNEENYEKELASLEGCDVNLVKAENEFKAIKEQSENIKDLKAKFDKYNLDSRNLEKEKSKANLAIETSTRLNNEYYCKNAQFLAEQAGIIAQNLKANTPCPVCGSLEHPAPAVVSEGAPTEKEVKQAKELADKANNTAQKLSNAVSSLRATVESLENDLLQCGKKFIPDFQLSTAENHIKDIEAKNRNDSDLANSKIEKLKKDKKRKEEIEKELPEIKEKKANLDNQLQEYKGKHNMLHATAEEKCKHIIKLKKELKFDSKEAAKNNIDKLKKQVNEIQKAYDEAKDKFDQINSAINSLEGEQNGLKKTLEKAVDYDESALNSIRESLSEQKDTVKKIRDSSNSRFTNNRENLKKIKLKSNNLIEVKKEYEWMNALSKTLNGQITGKERIQLETYVQMSYFDRIISKANLRLLMMTDNQYELKRREDNKNSGQVGLDLDVIDHYNGTIRSVASLSGGESFKASLSLALGLSDEVQSSAGGIKMDTMFVDEGFGSLDEESLQQALKALIGLSDNNRLVGIISHVSALNEKIDNKIIVKKDRQNGSNITIES